MKKIALALLGAGFVCFAQADANEAVREAAKASFSGIYFGGGVHVMNYQNECGYEYAPDVSPTKRRGDISVEESSNRGRLGGTIVLGIGKKLQSVPFYFALEGMLDFAPNTVARNADKIDAAVKSGDDDALQVENSFYSATVRRNGLIPSVGLRLAWASDCLQSLAYLKVAANFTRDTYKRSEVFANNSNKFAGKIQSELKSSKICPEVTLGLEKRFGKIGMRLEAGYSFGCGNKVKDAAECIKGHVNGDIGVGIQKPADAETLYKGDNLRIKKKGSVVLRMMAIMNLHVFN